MIIIIIITIIIPKPVMKDKVKIFISWQPLRELRDMTELLDNFPDCNYLQLGKSRQKSK